MMFHARLKKDSPRYEEWHTILDSDEVPLLDAVDRAVTLGMGSERAYRLDVKALTDEQRQRLVNLVVSKFQTPAKEVEQSIDAQGFPTQESC